MTWCHFLIGLTAVSHFSCRTPVADQASVAKEDQVRSCELENPITPKDLSGAESYAVSGRCLFGADPDRVHSVRIRILAETFAKILEDGCRGVDSGYGHVIKLFLDGYEIDNVGMRVRGNTSRCNEKRQFKLKFNEDEMYSVLGGHVSALEFPDNKDRRLLGVATFSLRASVNDRSFIRERLASKIFAEAQEAARQRDMDGVIARGEPVYRVSFAKLFVSYNRSEGEGPETIPNGRGVPGGRFDRLIDGYWYDYKGFYSIAEQIDKTFLKSRYQREEEDVLGSLIQTDIARAYFRSHQYDRRGFDFKFINGKKFKSSNAEHLDNADGKIAELISLLDRGDVREMTEKINIDNFATYAAGAMLAGHWDSLLTNRNNDYLYQDPQGRWNVIVWDLDNTLGAGYNGFHQYMKTSDIFDVGREHKVRLFYKTIFWREPFRSRLKERLGQLTNGFYRQRVFEGEIDELADVARRNAEHHEGLHEDLYLDIKNFTRARRNEINRQL